MTKKLNEIQKALKSLAKLVAHGVPIKSQIKVLVKEMDRLDAKNEEMDRVLKICRKDQVDKMSCIVKLEAKLKQIFEANDIKSHKYLSDLIIKYENEFVENAPASDKPRCGNCGAFETHECFNCVD